MLSYAVQRLFGVIPVILLVTLIVFTLNALIPGDPGRIRLGQHADPSMVEAWNREHGYLDPFMVQYGRYLGNVLLHGDLGESDVKAGQRVSEVITGAFWLTLRLAIGSIFIAVMLGVGAGIISAVRSRTWLDYTSMVIAIIGVSMPVFWLGILMIIFAVPFLNENIPFLKLPFSGFHNTSWLDQVRSLALPCTALGLISSATIARLTRSAMLDVLTQDYVRTARAKGLRERVVILRHALRNAAIPIVTVVGNSFGYLLVGAVLTESVFALPGLGRTIVDSIIQRDRMVITGGILIMSVIFVVVNLLVDLSYGFFDPRVRHGRG